MNRVKSLMKQCWKPIFGMIHIKPTPGSPKFQSTDSLKNIKSDAIDQARILLDCNVDGIVIENMFDRPYNLPKYQNPVVISLLSIIGGNIRELFPTLPIGIQVLTGCNHEALAIAAAADLDFIRCEGFVYGHIADEGWIQSSAASLLRYRREIQSEHVWIMADVKKKHSSHAVTADISLYETIKSAEFFLADSVIVTGNFTGIAPDLTELKTLKIKQDFSIPLVLGSGINSDNIDMYFNLADIFIVGSDFKKGGFWENDLDKERIVKLMSKVKKLRIRK